MASGDTISGTVEKEAAGKTDSEKAQNESELNGYVIDFEKSQSNTSEKTLTRNIPTNLTNADRLIRILREDRELAKVNLPISSSPGQPLVKFRLPTGGQQWRLILIKGPCDGLFGSGDYVKIGGSPIQVLAESPRMLIARNTSAELGQTKIECHERDQTHECPFRNLGIKLSADKLSLLKGEKTTLHLEVSGLDGIKRDVPLDLKNDTPSVIELNGGVLQHVTIRPGDVKSGGSYPTDRTLTGIKMGSFGITGTVTWNEECEDGKPIEGERVPIAGEVGRGSFAKDVQGPEGKDGKPAKYRTCGGTCKDPASDPSGYFCGQEKSCFDNKDCQCHMYDTMGEEDMSKWRHVWKPGDAKRQGENPNYRCLCVKPK
jgi:hypothetical protein